MKLEMKNSKLSSMAERLLDELIDAQKSRPHFLLELFESCSQLDTDEKRKQVLDTAKKFKREPEQTVPIISKIPDSPNKNPSILKKSETQTQQPVITETVIDTCENEKITSQTTDDERIQAFNNTFSAIHTHLSNWLWFLI